MKGVTGYERGIVGIATNYVSRYTDFHMCLDHFMVPNGSQISRQMGVNVAFHYNNMARHMLEDDVYRWVIMLGDDHVFAPDLLLRLLERDVDIVVPLCLRRIPPFNPVIHSNAVHKYKPVDFDFLHGKTGLIDVGDHNTGNAGMVVKRHVYETLPQPWFELGKTNPEMGGCDLYFCEKARKAGFKIYVDTDNCIGHIFHAAVWPVKDENLSYRPDVRIT
jgi:hypothetical protein